MFLLPVPHGLSFFFPFTANLYFTILFHMLLTFLWQREESFIAPIKLI